MPTQKAGRYSSTVRHTDVGTTGEPVRIVNEVMCIIVAVLFMASCSADRLDKVSDTEVQSGVSSDAGHAVQTYHGYAVHGHEVRSFRPCGSDDWLWVIGPSDLLWTLCKRFATPQIPYQEVFAVVEAHQVPAPAEGFGADYSGGIKIEAVLYAGLEGPGCNENWNAFQYHVYGNEPFWSLEVSDRYMRLSRPGSKDQSWHEISVTRAHDGIRYTIRDTTTPPVELIITREPCQDSMSGAYYAFAAVLRMGKVELRGCALQGRP